jgi:hypothetical protein
MRICKTNILPVVSCGYETWSLKLMEEQKLREFENMAVKGISVPKRNEVTGG